MPEEIKCLIVDDEMAAHYVLQHYIANVGFLTLIGQCYSVEEAITFLQHHKTDLIFLDIQMPERSGFDFLEQLHPRPPVVFTTAHATYALKSYDYGVMDYLLKPIAFSRFLTAIDRYLAFHQLNKDDYNGIGTYNKNSIDVKVDRKTVSINFPDLIYVQSMGNYVKIVTLNGEFITPLTTSEIEKKLPPADFTRIHKSYIVRLHAISGFNNQYVKINDVQLPVGITYRRELTDKLTLCGKATLVSKEEH